MRIRTILPALLGTMLMLGAASPAFADRDGGGRPDGRSVGWQDRGSWDRGWHDRGRQDRSWREQGCRERAWREQAWRERAWREHLWRERQALRFYPPGVAPGYPHWYR